MNPQHSERATGGANAMNRPTLTLGEHAPAIMEARSLRKAEQTQAKAKREAHAERERRTRDLQKRNAPRDNEQTNYLRVQRIRGNKHPR